MQIQNANSRSKIRPLRPNLFFQARFTSPLGPRPCFAYLLRVFASRSGRLQTTLSFPRRWLRRRQSRKRPARRPRPRSRPRPPPTPPTISRRRRCSSRRPTPATKTARALAASDCAAAAHGRRLAGGDPPAGAVAPARCRGPHRAPAGLAQPGKAVAREPAPRRPPSAVPGDKRWRRR